MKLTEKIIADKVIKKLGVNIRLTRRTSNAVAYRVIYTKLCTKLISTNLCKIGREINKHHATVIHYQTLSNNPNYFKIDRQTQYLNIYNELVSEYNLKIIEEPQQTKSLIKQVADKDRSYTKLLLKYNDQNKEIEQLRETNTKLIEQNFKLKLNK